MESNPLLETHALKKRYGNVTVLDNVSIKLRRGEVHAILGANGAGKSTLCKIISGLVPATEGTMVLEGESYHPKTKQAAEMAGVEMVQQELSLIGSLTVAENLFLNRLPHRFGVVNSRKLHVQARTVLDQFGLNDVEPRAIAGTLGVGRQQMIEIAAALARECRLLILDEPTAALSGRESERLFDQLRALRDQGIGIIYISHRLEEVLSLSDRVTVLRDGRFIETCETSELSIPKMVALMSGEEVSKTAADHVAHFTQNPALTIEGLSCGLVQDVSFQVRQGERFGITGLVGAGRTELLRAIFGADVASNGVVTVDAAKCKGQRFRSPSAAVKAGLAMVTEDRKENGLLLSQSIKTNTTLASLTRKFSRFGWIRQTKEHEQVSDSIQELDIRCAGFDQHVGALSGGNQQKVAISKWLEAEAEVYLFDEPTRGIDFAARKRIYQLLESLTSHGKTCVIVSSDLQELLDNCDRIAVISAGRLVKIFNRNDWSQEEITQASFEGYVA